jgi:hypothetical protein
MGYPYGTKGSLHRCVGEVQLQTSNWVLQLQEESMWSWEPFILNRFDCNDMPGVKIIKKKYDNRGNNRVGILETF